jgi:hypothetical protein
MGSVFGGVLYNRNSDGNLYVRYLNWDGDRWNWNYNWLDNDWNDDNPAALLANIFVPLPLFFIGRVLFYDLSAPTAQHAADFV